MSEMKHASVCYPPLFPLEGRLPRRIGQVQKTILNAAAAAYLSIMDVHSLAEAHKSIDAHWEAYYARLGEVNDAQA